MHTNKQPRPDFAKERTLMAEGYMHVAGVDEAGRGPWAGPVVAAAVILDPDHIPQGINDSKKMTRLQREKLCELLKGSARWGIGHCDVEEIDRINILQASLLAMRRAVDALAVSPSYVLVDGNAMPNMVWAGETMIKGDARSLSIAAASILAKVTRDKIMWELHEAHPQFGWDTNVGYGTRKHAQALEEFGVTPWHRRSFKPVRLRLEKDEL